jgi:hypothetical protein
MAIEVPVTQGAPIVTVITAVWNQQKDKLPLLRGHMENLRRQTAPVRTVYIFDDGDRAPDWLQGTAITVSEPLTLYQAWNVALSCVMSPLVMNLNLDDRLAPDAVEAMARAFEPDRDVFLVGGDWKICFDEAQTDDVRPCHPLQELPYRAEWPPLPGQTRRLGSGDHADLTHGPACMWRMEAHRRLPRYPYRFSDGSFIRIIGDAIWWHAIENLMGKKIVRLPLVIGNYRSDPATQAEFRYSAADERKRQDVLLF